MFNEYNFVFFYDRIIFVFHKNTNKVVKAKVQPPRLDGAKVGVFASRSPHRPNPIGLTLAKLDAIVGNTLFLSGIDVLDGTPVLDVKPYVPDYDKPVILPLAEDNLVIESIMKTKDKQNKDILYIPEPLNQPVAISQGPQLIVNEQTHVSPVNKNLDLRPESTTLSIAEWIRKAPIKELDVKFSDEAVHQISRFHGKNQHVHVLPEYSGPKELHEKSDDLSAYKICTCPRKCDEESKCFAVKTFEKLENYKQRNSHSKVSLKQPDGSSVTTDDRGSGEELKLFPLSKATLNEKPDQVHVVKAAKFGGLQEELSSMDKSSLLFQNDGNDSVKKGFQSEAEPDIVQPSNVCIYQLEMLSSPEEAKQAIADILKADPRSVYRRNRCQDQLYHFSIDTMNVTCRFEDSVVEVLQLEPVCYRKVPLRNISQESQ